jgi:2'-5' RNA ligase
MTQRCFIALEPPDEVAACLNGHLKEFSKTPGVNWVKPDNLHLTLLFLGDTDPRYLPGIISVMDSLARDCAPLILSLQGLTLFPAREPRLVWGTLNSEGTAIFGLHKALLKDIRALGCDPDPKPLKLHITLGRIKKQLPDWLERQIIGSPVDSTPLPFKRMTLYRSVLGTQGPTYHILQQFEINNRR